MAKKEIKTSIDISASPNIVWDLLSDFSNYKNWNPFLTSVQGELIEGNKLKIVAGGMKFQPTLLSVKKEKEIRWLGKLLIGGLFDGEHKFELIDNKNGTTTFIHDEAFNGLLVGLFSKKLDTETRQGFEQMNQKLKELAEAKAAAL